MEKVRSCKETSLIPWSPNRSLRQKHAFNPLVTDQSLSRKGHWDIGNTDLSIQPFEFEAAQVSTALIVVFGEILPQASRRGIYFRMMVEFRVFRLSRFLMLPLVQHSASSTPVTFWWMKLVPEPVNAAWPRAVAGSLLKVCIAGQHENFACWCGNVNLWLLRARAKQKEGGGERQKKTRKFLPSTILACVPGRGKNGPHCQILDVCPATYCVVVEVAANLCVSKARGWKGTSKPIKVASPVLPLCCQLPGYCFSLSPSQWAFSLIGCWGVKWAPSTAELLGNPDVVLCNTTSRWKNWLVHRRIDWVSPRSRFGVKQQNLI